MGYSKAQSANIQKPQQVIALGKTSKAEVSEWMGVAAETYADGGREIWVYSDKPKEIPFFISYIPVVGEIADAVELMQAMRKNHELIIQFDEEGLVRKYKRRELE